MRSIVIVGAICCLAIAPGFASNVQTTVPNNAGSSTVTPATGTSNPERHNQPSQPQQGGGQGRHRDGHARHHNYGAKPSNSYHFGHP